MTSTDTAKHEMMAWDQSFRQLNEGEIILPSDEVQNDDGTWRPAIAIGTKAPSPFYTSHRIYRRKEPHNDQ